MTVPSSEPATTGAVATALERRTIDVVPDAERHGSPRGQFTLWFGANMQVTAVVTGALAVILGAGGPAAIAGVLIGNVFGGILMALHAAQGPKLGLPQMISSRVQFGVRGASLPLILVILMYLGFASTGTVLAGRAINLLLRVDHPAVGILVFGAITAVIAIFGYRLIHTLGRIGTVVGILGFGYLGVRLFLTYDLGAVFDTVPFDSVAFVTAITLAAGWQMTYAPYVADYSRYLPRETTTRTTFWSSFAGTVLSSQIAMTFGILLALVGGDSFLTDQIDFLGALAGAGLGAYLTYLVIAVGKLTVNCLNAYGGFMTILTTVTGFNNATRISQLARSMLIVAFVAASVVIALAASADFLNLFTNFVLLLLAVFVPWSVINLVDYYAISRERVDIPALYHRDRRYGSVNIVALVSYLAGIAVQIPFMSQTLYTGPLAQRMNGLDISWVVSLFVTAAIYYPWAKHTAEPPEHMIYPGVPSEAGAVARPQA